MKKKKEPSKKYLREKADKLARLCALKKNGEVCEYCGKTENIQVHHFIPRSDSAYLRYNLKNLVCLCSYCHIIKLHRKADPDIVPYIIKSRGQDWYDNLKALKKKGLEAKSITTVKYYQEVIMALEEYLKRY